MRCEIAFVKNHEKRLLEYEKLSSQIGAHVYNVQGGGGNTSVKLNDELMAIKASGYKLTDIGLDTGYAVMAYRPLKAFYHENQAKDYTDVEATGAAEAKNATQEIAGLAIVRPSVEAGFHAMLERFVAHSHSVFANLAACSQTSSDIIEAAFSDAEYRIGLVPYTDPGAKLAFQINEVRERMKKASGTYPSAIVMQNHGLIVSADDVDLCLAIHDDANRRFARYFNLTLDQFPTIDIEATDEGYRSATAYLRTHLSQDRYRDHFFEKTLLYPDQQVFLQDAVVYGDTPVEGKATIHADGTVTYLMTENKAQVIEETLTSVVFIVETIRNKGQHLSVMGEEAQAFIGNWESEKYRKKIAEQST